MAQRIPVDWEDLELAFRFNSSESRSFLDLRTGKIETYFGRDAFADGGLSEEDADAGLAEGYFIRVDPIESSVEYRWMEDFADSVADIALREKLAIALNGRGGFPALQTSTFGSSRRTRRIVRILCGTAAQRDRTVAGRQRHRADHETGANKVLSEEESRAALFFVF